MEKWDEHVYLLEGKEVIKALKLEGYHIIRAMLLGDGRLRIETTSKITL